LSNLSSSTFSLQDVAASLVSVIIVIALSAHALTGAPVPAELSAFTGASITWLFVRSAQVAERSSSNHDN